MSFLKGFGGHYNVSMIVEFDLRQKIESRCVILILVTF